MATYGSFPGVQVETTTGGVRGVRVGAEEKIVIFGEAAYNDPPSPSDDDEDATSGSVDADTPTQINAGSQADTKFGDGSELADAIQDALANGANIDFLYGVAVSRINAVGETQSNQTGTLDHAPVFEDTSTITFDDDGTSLSVEFRYDGAPATPSDADTVFINPFTGEYAADSAPVNDFSVDYKYLDYNGAFTNEDVRNVVDEDETGIYAALSEADSVSVDLEVEVDRLRTNYQLVNGISPAEPNDNSSESPPDARYDTVNYSNANQNVTEEHYYKFAPTRLQDSVNTVIGGVAGLFGGNDLDNPVYNDELFDFDTLEQSFSKTDADNIRAEDIIPIRQAGSIRVRGDRSTAFGQSGAVAADFFTRRITDRVILIGKTVGDNTIGRIRDDETLNSAQRQIETQLRGLVQDGLIRANTQSQQYWTVDVYRDENNTNEVNIDISFTPFGIVKQVDETITVNTS